MLVVSILILFRKMKMPDIEHLVCYRTKKLSDGKGTGSLKELHTMMYTDFLYLVYIGYRYIKKAIYNIVIWLEVKVD